MHNHKVARACLGIHSGVRDFRREAGAVNMVVESMTDVQLALDGNASDRTHLLACKCHEYVHLPWPAYYEPETE